MKFLILCLIFAMFCIAVDVLVGANELTDSDELDHFLPFDHYSRHERIHKSHELRNSLRPQRKRIAKQRLCLLKSALHPEILTGNCFMDDEKIHESTFGRVPHHKRPFKRAAVLGGPQKVPQEEWPELHTKMQNAFTQLGAKHANFGYKYKNIIEATKQVVAGINYKLKVLVESVEESNDTTKECEVSVWEKAWENFQKFTFKCDNTEYGYTSTPSNVNDHHK